MLSYAFTSLNQSNYENLVAEEFENMLNLFAAILSKGIGQQLKQGSYRQYLNKKEDMSVMHGKIDMYRYDTEENRTSTDLGFNPVSNILLSVTLMP